MDGKEIEMFSHDHLYELIQDYQREAREAADRERLVHEAKEMQPESVPLRARLGVRLVEWGRGPIWTGYWMGKALRALNKETEFQNEDPSPNSVSTCLGKEFYFRL